MDRSLDPETTDKMSRLMTSIIPDILAFTLGNLDMALHVKTLFGVVQLGFPSLEPQVPSTSPRSKSRRLLAPMITSQSISHMCRRPGEDGERTTLEDYLIARKFQPVVQVCSILRSEIVYIFNYCIGEI